MKPLVLFLSAAVLAAICGITFIALREPAREEIPRPPATNLSGIKPPSGDKTAAVPKSSPERPLPPEDNGSPPPDANTAKDSIRKNGDYRDAAAFMARSSTGEKFIFMMQIGELLSPAGSRHDLTEKGKLIDMLPSSDPKVPYLREKALTAEAEERYDSLKKDGVLDELKKNELAIVYQAVARLDPATAFDKIADLKSEDSRRIAASAVARQWVTVDFMDASKRIEKIPPGPLRDEASAELVIGLWNIDSPEAAAWFDSIRDPKALRRLEESRLSDSQGNR